jgi:cytochrome b subunit of formate dehydrogenase
VTYSALLVWFVGPSVLFTASGIVLFRRSRSLASALVALGFAAVLIGATANALTNYFAVHHWSAAFAATVPGWVWTLAGLGSYGGMWIASLGLLWEVSGTRGAASPNNRWRSP